MVLITALKYQCTNHYKLYIETYISSVFGNTLDNYLAQYARRASGMLNINKQLKSL